MIEMKHQVSLRINDECKDIIEYMKNKYGYESNNAVLRAGLYALRKWKKKNDMPKV